MSLYDLHNAKLNEMEGEGFAYSEKTVYGKEYKGVFFGEDEDEIEKIVDGEEEPKELGCYDGEGFIGLLPSLP